MVNILILLALGLASSEKLDRTYLPPPGSKFAGGSPGDLQVPFELPKETFSTTIRPQSGRIDGLPTLGDPQVELGISRGIPSGTSSDFGISTSGTNAPFTYFQNAYNVPTTTTSYAFSQTTTLPPGKGYDITQGPINPNAEVSSQNPAVFLQTTSRPNAQEQYNQYTPGNLQYGVQSSANLGSNPQSGYVYPKPEEYANNGQLPYVPGVQLNQYQGQHPTLNLSPGNALQAPGYVQSYSQQGIVPSIVAPTSQQPSFNAALGNANQLPGYVQSYNEQDLSQYPLNVGQQYIPSTVAPTGSPIQLPGETPSYQPSLGQHPQDQGSLNIGQHFSGPSPTTAQGTPGAQIGVFNGPSFDPNGSNTPQIGYPGQDANQFIPSRNVELNQPTYSKNIYQANEPGSSIPQQYPSITGNLEDPTPFNGDRNVYNPSSTAAPGPSSPNFPSFSGIPNSSSRLPAGVISPSGIYSLTSTTAPSFSDQDAAVVNYKVHPERPQAESDRNAVILSYENVRTPQGYSYSFDTSNGIHADESGIIMDGTKAQGSYSYIGDDGKLYSVVYTADENGFQPRGDHLPTTPPIPEAIQRVIEQAARDREAGISDDGSYDEAKYGHKKYQNGQRPRDQHRMFNNGADIPDMNENHFSEMRQKQFRPQANNQFRPVSTTEDYGAKDNDNGQDYENEEVINQPGDYNNPIESDRRDNSQENISIQSGRAEMQQPSSEHPGSLKNSQNFAQKPEGFDENSSFERVRADTPSETGNSNMNRFLNASQRPDIADIAKHSATSRPKEENQYGSKTQYIESGKPTPSGTFNDNTNVFDGRQTNLPSNFGNKVNQPTLNPRTEFTTLQPINDDIGYQYNRPENNFSQGGNSFPSRFTQGSTRKPVSPASTTAKPFITPNIYRNDEETQDDSDQQTLSPIYSTSGAPTSYDEERRLGYGQSTTPDQIIGDDEISYTTVSAPRKTKPSSTRRPSYDGQNTARPYIRYPTSDQRAFDNGNPSINQKVTVRPGQRGGNRYPSSTSFRSQTPGFVPSTTQMPKSFTSTLTPQRTSGENRYQAAYKPTVGPNFSDSPSRIRPGTSRIPLRPVGSTQGLPSSTYRPTFEEMDGKLAPGIKVDGFGRPIEQYNQFSDGKANPSSSPDSPVGNYQDPRPSSGVRGSQRPGSNEEAKTTFKPDVVRFGEQATSIQGTTSKPVPGYSQTTERVFGEDFSGPKRPQTFDPETGYHY